MRPFEVVHFVKLIEDFGSIFHNLLKIDSVKSLIKREV